MLSATIICGNPGAGKSAFARHLLHEDGGPKSLWLADDARTLNIDVCSLDMNKSSFGPDRVLTFRNGSSVVFAPDITAARLADIIDEGMQHVFLISSGDPRELVERLGLQHSNLIRVERMLLVIDTVNYARQLQGKQLQGAATGDLTETLIAECQAIILNKRDLVTREEMDAVRRAIQHLNPSALIEETRFGRADGSKLMEATLPVFNCDRLFSAVSPT
jgi:G3E family GTPase